jgi:hypothetical protein
VSGTDRVRRATLAVLVAGLALAQPAPAAQEPQLASVTLATAPTATAQAPACEGAPWMDTGRSAGERADLLVREMTLDEKVSMLHAVSDSAHARETPSRDLPLRAGISRDDATVP